VKKSRFVAWAWAINSPEEAEKYMASRRDPAATHNCFAYKIHSEYRSSDDGEPGGTAGRPILGAIESEGLNGVAILVTRYFGGVKLGTGGLVRAYARASRTVLQSARRVEVRAKVTLRAEVPFDALGSVYQAADSTGARRVGEEYAEGGVCLFLEVDAGDAVGLENALKDSSSGRIKVEIDAVKGLL